MTNEDMLAERLVTEKVDILQAITTWERGGSRMPRLLSLG